MTSQRSRYVRNLPAEKVELKGRIVHQTADAYLFSVASLNEQHWFPASQVHSAHREFVTLGADRLIVSAWIAKKRGII